jgi:NADH-quinone oxidoreductase subunit G
MAEPSPPAPQPAAAPAPQPQPPPPSTTVTLKIDGRDVTVPKGTNVLEAALSVGVDVPYFCYHPGLSIAAACRQCLVEVKGQTKLQPSCQLGCADKMEILTQSERALVAREQMLEFTLVNHPVDCPICDKAGECNLQKLYFEWDARASRIDMDKVHKAKAVDIGPHIVLDQERCILCTRCIRVCDEVAHNHQVTMAYRHDTEVLTTAPGKQLDNPYSLNTVDVCPVGALTSKDFRFSVRVWQLQQTATICPGCATGCNVELHHAYGEAKRLVPRHNDQVNKYWMCDEGRFTYKEIRRERLAVPRVSGTPARWDAAIAEAATRLKDIQDKGLDVGLVLSAAAINEDNFALKAVLKAAKVYVYGHAPRPEREDDILRAADVNPNRAGVAAIAGEGAGDRMALERDLEGGKLGALVVLGEAVELSGIAMEAAGRLGLVLTIASHDQGLVEKSHVALPALLWAEVDGTFTNRKGMTQRLRRAVPGPENALPAWEIAARLARKQGAEVGAGWSSARAVFLEMRSAVGGLFAHAELGRDLPTFQLRFANSRG